MTGIYEDICSVIEAFWSYVLFNWLVMGGKSPMGLFKNLFKLAGHVVEAPIDITRDVLTGTTKRTSRRLDRTAKQVKKTIEDVFSDDDDVF